MTDYSATYQLERDLLDGAQRFDRHLAAIRERLRSAGKLEKGKNYDMDVSILLDIIHKLAPNERYGQRDCCASRLNPLMDDFVEVLQKHGCDISYRAVA